MNPDMTETLCEAVTDADSDIAAIAAVTETLHKALRDVYIGAKISSWGIEQDKDEFLALIGHLTRAVSMLVVGTTALGSGSRDFAWVLLNAATRPVAELLAISPDTTAFEQATVTYLRLDKLEESPAAGSTPDHVHPPIATVSQITDIRLSRTPGVFLDEEDLDARYVSITWDLIATSLTHIQEHIRHWWGMGDFTAIVHAVEQAKTLREDIFPSAA